MLELYGTAAAAAPGGGRGSGVVVLQQLLHMNQWRVLDAGYLKEGCASVMAFHDMP